jgi:hypothetical protein
MKKSLLISTLFVSLVFQLNAQLVKLCNGECSAFRVESTVNKACGSKDDLTFTVYDLTGYRETIIFMYAQMTDGKWYDFWGGSGFSGSDHVERSACKLTGRYVIYYYDNYAAMNLNQWRPGRDSIPGVEYVNKMFGSDNSPSTSKLNKKEKGYLFLIAKETWNSYQERNNYGLKKNVKLRVYFSNVKGISEFNCKGIIYRDPVEIDLCANEGWVNALKSNGLNPDNFEIECVTGDALTIGKNFFPDENSASTELQRRKQVESNLEFQTLKDLVF